MLQEFVKQGDGVLKPQGALGQGVSRRFQCEDGVALYREFLSRGIEAKEPFVGNSMWVTVLSDPDGYKLDFESPTDLPGDTKLSEVEK
jgi:lactoylglutathione lyase